MNRSSSEEFVRKDKPRVGGVVLNDTKLNSLNSIVWKLTSLKERIANKMLRVQ